MAYEFANYEIFYMKIKTVKPKHILKLSHEEARLFFLKHESYFNADLPSYFSFTEMLHKIAKKLGASPLKSFFNVRTKPDDYKGVNHTIFSNKDGKLSWRPLQLIHPVLYVNLVREITKKKNWKKIKNRFSKMKTNKNIMCLSMPVQSLSDLKDRAAKVNEWWQEVELRSIENALDYEFLYETDISDCYGSFYTHSIAWAMETKVKAKNRSNRQNTSLLGVFIDHSIREMQNGQSNGIPQGSVLMDFVAEMILGYADLELSKKLKNKKIAEFKILRYRDDYRIFVNSSEVGEAILKNLSEVFVDLGLRLNTSKTKSSSDIVSAAIKSDKKAWISAKNYHKNLLKHCMLIKQHSDIFPNSGSLSVSLSKFYKRVLTLKQLDEGSLAVVSIVIDIAYKNPKVYPVCFAIFSKFLALIPSDRDKMALIKKVQSKFTRLPNVGYMEIWFQRAIKVKLKKVFLNEPLCKLVKGKKVEIWNSDWISSPDLKNIIKSVGIIDHAKLIEAEPIINSIEFDLFPMASG